MRVATGIVHAIGILFASGNPTGVKHVLEGCGTKGCLGLAHLFCRERSAADLVSKIGHGRHNGGASLDVLGLNQSRIIRQMEKVRNVNHDGIANVTALRENNYTEPLCHFLEEALLEMRSMIELDEDMMSKL
jgi:hypothetical protein